MKDEGKAPTDLKGEAHNAAGLVHYGDGSIVSRVIVKQPTGNVTLFAFDNGQELSEHTAPFDAMVHVVEGETELLIGGKPVRVRAGEFCIMPANIPHAVKAVSKFKMILTMIRS